MTQQNNYKLQLIRSNKKIIIPLVFLYLLIVFISAWLCDDSYITFRTVDNFINGFGLTWNISERVQAFTHPLWMFVISVFYFMTREIYYTSLVISILISVGTVSLLLYKLLDSSFNSIFIILILIFSKAFIDYSTSGLENPLTHLLLVLFFIVYFNREDGNKKIFLLSIIVSFALLNRMDTILVLMPVLIITYLKGDKLKGLLIVVVGFLPLIIWEIFSLLYYGFPFPNTAYAKLNTGINQVELAQQGLHYLLFSFYFDPLTPITIIVGFLIPVFTKNKNLLPVSIGIGLYLVYLVTVGGDFMGGRFLSVPLLCSVIIISKINPDDFVIKPLRSFIIKTSVILIVIILGFLSPRPTILTNANYGLGPKIFEGFRFGPYILKTYNGIADERMWYYETTGLLNNLFERKLYKNSYIEDGIKSRSLNKQILVEGIIGFFGYYSKNNTHIVDPLALSEPLLSKLHSTASKKNDNPLTKESNKWRIGHFARKIPDGYIETLSSGINVLQDLDLREYYDKLSIVIKGDIFDFNRVIEIWNLNTGKYDYLLNRYNNKLTTNSNTPTGLYPQRN